MPTPVHIVQAQLDAYNARDIDAFCATFDVAAEVFELETGALRMAGLDAIRQRYGQQFIDNPNQRSLVVSRQHVGQYVFDLELITGTTGRPDAHVMAIYRVNAAVIDRAWFTPRTPIPASLPLAQSR